MLTMSTAAASQNKELVKRRRLNILPTSIDEVKDKLNPEQVKVNEPLPVLEDAQDPQVKLKYMRILSEQARTQETVNLEDWVKSGTCIILIMPGAGTPVCTEDELREYIERFPEFKAKGLKIGVMTKDNCHVLDTLWLKPMLIASSWFQKELAELDEASKVEKIATMRVKDYIEPIADVNQTILNTWGIVPLFSDKLGSFAPRGLILVDEGMVKNIVFESTPKTCVDVSPEKAINMVAKLKQEASIKEALKI